MCVHVSVCACVSVSVWVCACPVSERASVFAHAAAASMLVFVCLLQPKALPTYSCCWLVSCSSFAFTWASRSAGNSTGNQKQRAFVHRRVTLQNEKSVCAGLVCVCVRIRFCVSPLMVCCIRRMAWFCASCSSCSAWI